MSTFNCQSCGLTLSAKEALAQGSFSWPEMSTFWVPCSRCDAGLHLLTSDGCLTQVKIISAPGAEWAEIAHEVVEGLSSRIDPAFLHVWAFGRHYEYPART